MYDYMHSGAIDLEAILDVADMGQNRHSIPDEILTKLLGSLNRLIRFGSVMDILNADKLDPLLIKKLEPLLQDSSAAVATLAAKSLYHLGEKDQAVECLARIILNNEN
jgi:hypothetical protein